MASIPTEFLLAEVAPASSRQGYHWGVFEEVLDFGFELVVGFSFKFHAWSPRVCELVIPFRLQQYEKEEKNPP